MFEITEVPGTGLGLVATCDIETNRVILDEHAAFLLPMSALDDADLLSATLARLEPKIRAEFATLHGDDLSDKLTGVL